MTWHPETVRQAKVVVVAQAAGAVAWLASVNWTGVATGIVAMATTLTLGFLYLRGLFRADHRKWEDENKDSLTERLRLADDRNAETMAKLTELTESVATERKSIHEQRDEANKRHLTMLAENQDLRNQISQLVGRLIEASGQLDEANRHVVDLTAEVQSLRLGTARQTQRIETAVKQVAGQVAVNTDDIAALSGKSGEFPAVTPPPIPPAPRGGTAPPSTAG
jgi:uncharacterized membrane protein YgaE (UPF0421/DUF939 family)